MEANGADTLLTLRPAIHSHHRPGSNWCEAVSQQARFMQKSSLFLPVFGLKRGVSPGCGPTAMRAPTLSCTCALKSIHCPICFPASESYGVE